MTIRDNLFKILAHAIFSQMLWNIPYSHCDWFNKKAEF